MLAEAKHASTGNIAGTILDTAVSLVVSLDNCKDEGTPRKLATATSKKC
jgi:hypothetical protein